MTNTLNVEAFMSLISRRSTSRFEFSNNRNFNIYCHQLTTLLPNFSKSIKFKIYRSIHVRFPFLLHFSLLSVTIKINDLWLIYLLDKTRIEWKRNTKNTFLSDCGSEWFFRTPRWLELWFHIVLGNSRFDCPREIP